MNFVNWRLKIFAKIMLARLPISYGIWKKLGFFQLGQMGKYAYSEKIFSMHFKNFSSAKRKNRFSMLELGPGDSLLSALFGYLNGAETIYLLDVGNFADTDVKLYKNAFDRWCEEHVLIRPAPDFGSFDSFLSSINAFYLVGGLAEFRNIESGTVDFSFSHSVLEHVRKAEIDSLLLELYRVSAPESTSSHNVDYMDHLGGAQNNLRFSDAVWESGFFVKSGFYTNRIPPHIMHQKMRNVGFNVIHEGFGVWNTSLIEDSEVHPDLRGDYDHRLSAPTSSIILSKGNQLL